MAAVIEWFGLGMALNVRMRVRGGAGMTQSGDGGAVRESTRPSRRDARSAVRTDGGDEKRAGPGGEASQGRQAGRRRRENKNDRPSSGAAGIERRAGRQAQRRVVWTRLRAWGCRSWSAERGGWVMNGAVKRQTGAGSGRFCDGEAVRCSVEQRGRPRGQGQQRRMREGPWDARGRPRSGGESEREERKRRSMGRGGVLHGQRPKFPRCCVRHLGSTSVPPLCSLFLLPCPPPPHKPPSPSSSFPRTPQAHSQPFSQTNRFFAPLCLTWPAAPMLCSAFPGCTRFSTATPPPAPSFQPPPPLPASPLSSPCHFLCADHLDS
ncbi:hypothetical protein C8Q77DRAFT_102451 [Trametes polyzona]|nr:hypothetical protein C8Q77DRAFT_102451 [Trametes polyzona]